LPFASPRTKLSGVCLVVSANICFVFFVFAFLFYFVFWLNDFLLVRIDELVVDQKTGFLFDDSDELANQAMV
jgi:hypothetical protein